ncbi:MAG: hypothetical protein AB1714_09015 [Acidobacteriota bacterium]
MSNSAETPVETPQAVLWPPVPPVYVLLCRIRLNLLAARRGRYEDWFHLDKHDLGAVRAYTADLGSDHEELAQFAHDYLAGYFSIKDGLERADSRSAIEELISAAPLDDAGRKWISGEVRGRLVMELFGVEYGTPSPGRSSRGAPLFGAIPVALENLVQRPPRDSAV